MKHTSSIRVRDVVAGTFFTQLSITLNKIFDRIDTIYIGLPGLHWHMLPARDFARNEDRYALLRLLRDRCGNAWRPRPT